MNPLSRLRDPRCYQIAVLATLLSIGVLALDFGIHWQEADVRERQEREARLLASMTGWDTGDIRDKIPFAGGLQPAVVNEPWWTQIWN